VNRLLSLYPGWWRRRYEAELGAVLLLAGSGRSDGVDLLRGALDAWLHPPSRSRLAAVAALTGGAMWTVVGLLVAREGPTDWPGYAIDSLPLAAFGALALAVATASLWLRLGDRTTVAERGLLVSAVAGHVAWFVGLVLIGLGWGVGPGTGIASAFAAIGAALVGVALVARGDLPVGGVLAAAPVALVVALPATWLLFGLLWTVVGLAAWPRPLDAPAGVA
jgi:hypothetical protein